MNADETQWTQKHGAVTIRMGHKRDRGGEKCCVLLMMCLVVLGPLASAWHPNEEVTPPHQLTHEHVPEVIVSHLPWKYVSDDVLPKEFSWTDANGYSLVTPILNQVHPLCTHNLIFIAFLVLNSLQHNPKYCGSCWLHAALSSLADRIKIRRKGKGVEINLSVQSVLNCGGEMAGSCYGGSALGVFEWGEPDYCDFLYFTPILMYIQPIKVLDFD